MAIQYHNTAKARMAINFKQKAKLGDRHVLYVLTYIPHGIFRNPRNYQKGKEFRDLFRENEN